MKERRLISLALSTLCALPPSLAKPSDVPAYLSAQISKQQWATQLADVQSQTGVTCKSIALSQYICDSPKQHTIWVFTQPGHPAHPALTRGAMVITSETIGIERTGQYAGDRAAFVEWMKEFAALDARQVDEWTKAISR
jgi:hypothetical protein